jgi:hypothetical protein
VAIDLLFSQASASSGSLVFGDETAGPVSKDASVTLSAVLPGLSGSVVMALDELTLTLAGTLPGLSGTMAITSQARSALSMAGALPSLSGAVSLVSSAVSLLTAGGKLPGLSGSVLMGAQFPTLITMSGTLPGLSGLVLLTLERPAALSFAGSFPSLSGSIALAYDNKVTRWLDSRVLAAHQPAVRNGVGAEAAWTPASKQRGAMELDWERARPDQGDLTAGHFLSLSVIVPVTAAWTPGESHTGETQARHQQAVPHEKTARPAWQDAVQRPVEWTGSLQTGVFQVVQPGSDWQVAASLVRDLMRRLGASTGRSGLSASDMPWQVAGQARNGLSILPVRPGDQPPFYIPSGALLFECPPLRVPSLVFGPHACCLSAVIPGAIAVPVLRTYVTINSIALRRIDSNVPIPTHAFGISLDADSWTWSWSASIPLAALPLVQPGSDGAPVEVEAMVNGVPYRLYAEGVASQRQFAQGRIAVKGRGLAAVLDAPYAPVRNHGNASGRTAQQLMADVLSVNGVTFDWAVDWTLTDWLVPGNTWTHQGAYIAAILDIAKAAGGYVQPHNTDQTLRILPRYPAAPWDWASVTPDFELPSAAVSVEGIDWTRKADYDRVFVSGTQNGVLGQVTRAGTAGEKVAPMVTDSLITHAAAARQRGLAILSDTGRQARVTLTLPVLAETGLIKPGQFVRYQDGADSRLGLVRSTSLAWSRPKLRQTIAVETHA